MRQVLTKLAYRFLRWRGSKGSRPNSNDIITTASAWDYAEADKQDWSGEPDPERLSKAIAMRGTDWPAAIAEFRALAALGSPRALDQLGEAYYWGRGLPCDRSKGERWFQCAYEAGSRRGLLNYGKALFARHELDAAARVFAVGIQQRWGPAYYWTARIEGNRPGSLCMRTRRAMPWLVRAASMGSPDARGSLGVLMMLGFYGSRRRKRGKQLVDKTLAALKAQVAAKLAE